MSNISSWIRVFAQFSPEHLLLVNGRQPCQAWARAHQYFLQQMAKEASEEILWKNKEKNFFLYQPPIPNLIGRIPGTLNNDGLLVLFKSDYELIDFPSLLRHYLNEVNRYYLSELVKVNSIQYEFVKRYKSRAITGVLAITRIFFSVHGATAKRCSFDSTNRLFNSFMNKMNDHSSNCFVYNWPMYQYLDAYDEDIFIALPSVSKLEDIYNQVRLEEERRVEDSLSLAEVK
mmetsp:Transcript_3770/g.5276  ORF Transcript_3770/g.5276 Transcript_3770/m.5276 type:complete len:231 (+) Transcript_3770:83-775(+)